MGTRSPTVQPLALATVSLTASPPEARSSRDPAVVSVRTTCWYSAGSTPKRLLPAPLSFQGPMRIPATAASSGCWARRWAASGLNGWKLSLNMM
jgi:hypothetical protein